MSVPIFFVPTKKFNAGRGAPIIALVHHRMVGTLGSTDFTFVNGARKASTNFGVGLCSVHGTKGRVEIHQYVNLDDSAWGNGNWDPTGNWFKTGLPTKGVNARTISIEHHDNGGLKNEDPRKGVVPEEVIAASIWLDRLLLSGDVAAWRAAGIRWRVDANAAAIAAQLRKIVPNPQTIIDHHTISGKLKPFCWRPWMGDATGFPRDRYISELSGTALPDTSTAPDPLEMQVGAIKGEDWIPALVNGQSSGVLRAEPDVASPEIARLDAGVVVRTIAEVTTNAAPPNHNWRLTEHLGKPAYLLRRDWTPLVQGGDPAVDALLTRYIERG
jgi:N-acetylmuramoyl-L-alanine amidase